MSLTLYFHPLSSFCMKVLIALYENDTPFEREIVDLSDPVSNASFKKIWPIGKFPVLRDSAAGRIVPESSIIVEYLDRHFPGRTRLLSDDPDRARQIRFHDRFYDMHVHLPMQRIVGDRLRPAGNRDPYGVAETKSRLQIALDMIEHDMAGKTWCVADQFTLADCSAGPPLFYVDKLMPFGATHRNTRRYLDRLMARPSFARALKEAEPYFSLFPEERAAS